jgi:hypothetical protein
MSRSQRPGSGVVPGGRLGVQKGANSTRAATFCAHRKQCPPCARASTHLFSGGTKCATEGGVGALYTRIMCVCAVCRLASRLASRLVACRVIFLNILRPCPGFARVVSERMSSLRVHIGVQVCDAMAFSAAWIGSTDVRAPLGQGARLSLTHTRNRIAKLGPAGEVTR